MKFMKMIRKWWQDFNPTIVTTAKMRKMYDDAYAEIMYRFENNKVTDAEYALTDTALFNYNVGMQKRKRAAAPEGNQEGLLSPEAVAFAASNDWLNVDTLHWRHQDMSALRDFQNVTYARIYADPYASSVVHQFLFYILGTGYTFSVSNKRVTSYLEELTQRFAYTKITGTAGHKVFSLMSMGEFYLKIWISPKGNAYLDRVFPFEVIGVMRHPVRRDKILGYNVQANGGQSVWIKDIKFDDYVSAEDFKIPERWKHAADFNKLKRDKDNYIHYTKVGWGEELLGRVPFEPALRNFKYREDFLLSRVILNRERGRVIWKKVLKGGTQARAGADRFLPPPTPGMMLVATDDIDYESVSADIRADEVTDDYKAILYALAANFSIPLELLDQRGNEQVYASIKKTSNPFHQKIMVLRTVVANSDEEFYQFTLKKKRERGGSLPKVVTKQVRNPEYPLNSEDNWIKKDFPLERCPIDITWSNNFTEDWGEVAKATKELTEAGAGSPIMSKTTARRRLGLSDVEEDSLIETEQTGEEENEKTSNSDDSEGAN